jgi:hypothetical protein
VSLSPRLDYGVEGSWFSFESGKCHVGGDASDRRWLACSYSVDHDDGSFI